MNKQQEIFMIDSNELISNCCSSKIYEGDICSTCKEHCWPLIQDSQCKKCGSLLDIDGQCIDCGQIDKNYLE